MTVASLSVSQFRNLEHIEFSCSPQLNLITGANAAGKTSLLEAIFFLSRGRSFRGSSARELIRSQPAGDSAEALRVLATVEAGPRRLRHQLGVERSRRELSLRVDGQTARSLLELADYLPVLLLNPDSHRLLEDGPRERRRFMDWGLFHGEPRFIEVWKRYRVALKHRNAALRSGASAGSSSDRSLAAWETELVAAAEVLDQLRNGFCQALEATVKPFLQDTLGEPAVVIDYRRGWSQEQSLADLLERDRQQDRLQGFTRSGPHRGDFVVKTALYGNKLAAKEVFSRGQQKLLIIALVMAQAQLYQQRREAPCLLLIDDLPAELDSEHRRRVMRCLAAQPVQLFLSAIESDQLDVSDWPSTHCQRLHLSGGKITKML